MQEIMHKMPFSPQGEKKAEFKTTEVSDVDHRNLRKYKKGWEHRDPVGSGAGRGSKERRFHF